MRPKPDSALIVYAAAHATAKLHSPRTFDARSFLNFWLMDLKTGKFISSGSHLEKTDAKLEELVGPGSPAFTKLMNAAKTTGTTEFKQRLSGVPSPR